jgi:glycerophosphoryl diester phosphodiesterase
MKALLRTRVSCLGCIIVGIVIVAVLHLVATPAAPFPWFDDLKKPLILAHQGGNLEWPSCTMFAFRQARLAGSDVLDLDLQMTKDKVLVLIHDTTVQRTTDGQGAVAEMTWAELEQLDAAYNFTLDGKSFALRGQGIGIPRLVDVLEIFDDWKFQIEVKQAPLELAPELARVLKEYEAEDKVLLSCFNEEMMVELRRHCPDVASSATPAEIRKFTLASFLHLEGLLSPEYSALQVPLRASGWDLVTPRTVQAAANRGLTVLPWTIDTDADLEVCRQAGVAGFNTNLPTKMEGARANWLRPDLPLFLDER